MRLKIPVLVAALLAGITLLKPNSAYARDDLTKQLSAFEQSLWEAWADSDATPFERHLKANHPNIGGQGIVAGRHAVCGGVPSASEVVVSCAYVLRVGTWLNAMFHETPIP